MATLGNVNIDGLSLSSAMQSDLAGGMSVAAFNSKYAGGGFQPINTNRQVGAAAPAPAAVNPATANLTSDSQALSDFAASNKASMDALLARQNAEQQGLFGQYSAAIAGQEKLPDLYTRLQGELGIPALSEQTQNYKNEIYRTQALLDKLPDDVTSRTQGTYTTEAQRDRIIAAEGDPLRTSIGRLGTGLQPFADMLTGAQGQLSTLLPLYEQQQQKDLSPLELQINSVSERFAREITGFTDSKQTQLDAILDKLNRDRTLSDREWQAAQDLAKEERDYQHNLSLAKVAASSNAGNYLGGGGGTPNPATLPSVRSLPTLSMGSSNNAGGVLQPANMNLQPAGFSLQGGSLRLQ